MAKPRRTLEDRGAIDGGTPFKITVTGRDRRPAWKRMYQNPNLGDTSQYYNGDVLEDVVSFVPGLGDAVDGVKAVDTVNRGNYLEAGILGAGLLLPNVIEKPVKAISKTVRKLISKTRKTPIEKSNLIWDAQQMFKDGNNHSYTQEDIDILNSHIPEYKEIEKTAKANGTYLKMPDGSIWKGDPREWVIAQSKNVKANYGPEILTHGDSDAYIDIAGADKTGDVLGSKEIWTSTNPYLGSTYGNKRYRFVIPKDADIKTMADAQGRYWRDVKPGVDTNRLVYPNLTEDNVIRINNVVDRGPNEFFYKEWPTPHPKEGILDYYKRVFTGDDLVLGKNIRRKALLGNNGMFDINNPNIFKVLWPAGIGGTAYGISKEK